MPLITTTHGDMDPDLLEKREGIIDDDNETTHWVEYYLGEELVHRSAHVTLKKWPDGLGALSAVFGGEQQG